MKSVRFIHCADLHIDSPFKGVSEVHPDLRELLYQSTYQAFSNVVNLAIKEKVDCVLVAGDVYDSTDRSLRAQLNFRDELKRLSEANITAFIVHGNHDPLDSWSATLEWPEHVHIFGDQVESQPLFKDGEIIAQISGISFPKRDIYDNLALQFQGTGQNIPNIGLLHANVGHTEHEPYAPCTIEDLSMRDMDFWALGHVHTPMILKASNPAIVYSGCTQSRNPREAGEKGCYLTTLEPGSDPAVQFVSTDVFRYKSDVVDISACSNVDDVISSIKRKCEDISDKMDRRHAVIRLALTGRSELHSELHKGNTVGDVLEHVREYFEGKDSWIWLEKLVLNTAGTYDLQSLRSGEDFIADIISIYDDLENGEGSVWKELQERLETLFSNWQGQKYLEQPSKEELLELAREARSLTLDEFSGT